MLSLCRCRVYRTAVYKDTNRCRWHDSRGILENEKPGDGQAVVFMGHGSEHFANASYQRLQKVLHGRGHEDYYISTVEGTPRLQKNKRLKSLTAAAASVIIILFTCANIPVFYTYAQEIPIVSMFVTAFHVGSGGKEMPRTSWPLSCSPP